MNFDPLNCFLKIQDYVGILTPKTEIHLGVCGLNPSQSLALQECKCDFHVALLTRTFPCPYIGCKPKTRVVTNHMVIHQGLYHKRAKSPNKNLVGVLHPTFLLNKREKINVGGVVGRIERTIISIFFRQLPPTPILANLAPIIRRMGHDADHCFMLHSELWLGEPQTGNARKSPGFGKGPIKGRPPS